MKGAALTIMLAVGLTGSVSTAPARTGLVYDSIYLEHITGPRHPERPERLKAIIDGLKTRGLFDRLALLKPRAAERQWLETVHRPEHIDAVAEACRRGDSWIGMPDTPICRRSYDVALMAVGGVLAATDAVMQGRVNNAFCAIRPPGHHATPTQAMGFCLFNNVAIAARYLQRRWRINRVLIVDWDVHHGNGTQEIFYDDPTVFYFSVHRYPFYPGSGSSDETGIGKGRGFTLNVPLPAGSGDEAFIDAFRERLLPAAQKFHPDFILISAGFDAHNADPLGGMSMSAAGYGELTRIVMEIAEQCCGGRIVSVLEGGYNLEALAASVAEHIRQLLRAD